MAKAKKSKKSGSAKSAKGGDSHTIHVGAMLLAARESVGMSQENLARKLNTKRTAISRIENHAEDIKLSTLERVAKALGKELKLKIQ